MRKLLISLVCIAAFSTAALAQDDHNDAVPVVVGYAIVTTTAGAGPFPIPGGLSVFETFGSRSQFPALQAGVLPSAMTTRTVVFTSSGFHLSRNVGIAITNPGNTAAVVTMTLRRTDGSVASIKTIALAAGNQISRFVSEYFSDVPEVPRDFNGSLMFTSNTPVAIMGLYFQGTKFTAIPITSLSPTLPIPNVTSNVGGLNSTLLPQFAANGGWASEMVVLNTAQVALTVRIDLFQQDGTPLVATLNHQPGSTFQNLVIQPGGIVIVAPLNANGDSDF